MINKMERRKGKPDYFYEVDENYLNSILKDSPINDFLHHSIISAYWTLIDYDKKNYGKLYPISCLDMAQVLEGSDEISKELLYIVEKGFTEIYLWDKEHGNLILGKGGTPIWSFRKS